MKSIINGLILLLYTIPTYSQVFDWGYQFPAQNSESMWVDNDGNVYLSGWFYGTVDFQSGPGTFNVTADYSTSTYVLKMDSMQNVLWVKQFKDSHTDITVDNSGNVYVLGNFYGTGDFDPGPGVYNFTTTTGYDEYFLVKLNSQGDLVWANHYSVRISIGYNNIWDILIGPDNKLYISGHFFGSGDFDPGPGVLTLSSSGLDDAFMLRIDLNGNTLWAIRNGNPKNNYITDFDFDTTGHIYLSGIYIGNIDMDPGPGSYVLSGQSLNSESFILKIDTTGSFVWAKKIGGTSDEEIWRIKIDNNRIVILGEFYGTADFDPSSGVYNIAASGSHMNFFLATYQLNNCVFNWAKSTAPTGANAVIRSLSIDDDSNIYLGGSFRGTFDFDFDTTVYNISSINTEDAFSAKYFSNGSLIWVNPIRGNINWDITYDNFIDSENNYYACGSYNTNINVDIDPGVGVYNLMGGGTFAFKHNGCSLPIDSSTVYSCGPYNSTYHNITFNSSGVYWLPELSNVGCDSITLLTLIIDSTLYSNASISICMGDSLVQGTNTYFTTGIYEDSLVSVGGCDSIVTLDLYVYNPNSVYSQIISLCFGDSVLLGSNYYYSTGTYIDTLINNSGCDSIVVLNLTVNNTNAQYMQNISICNSDTLYIGGNSYTISGSYVDTLINSTGCDSIMITNLVVNSPLFFSQSLSICYGDSIQVGSSYYSISGNYTDTLTSYQGCDSILYTSLTVDSQITFTQNLSICDGDYISVGNSVYSANGTYIDTLFNTSSCDSIITTNLFVTVIDTTLSINSDSLSANQSSATYQWYDCFNSISLLGQTNQIFIPSQSGYYSCIITLNNCNDTTGCSYFNYTGIIDTDGMELFLVPNPTNGIVELIIGNKSLSCDVEVYDIRGTLLQRISNVFESHEFDFSFLEDGIYFMKVDVNNKYYYLKFVKE